MLGSNASLDESRDILLLQIKNLESFCNDVLSIKLFWTQDILNFFEVPKDLHANFEKERGKYESKCQSEIEGVNRQDNERR